jgi:hypothetical protein
MSAYLEEDPWDEPDEGDYADELSGRRRLLQWLLTAVGIVSLVLGLVLIMPGLPLPGPRPILAIVLLISVGAWLLRLAWQR